MGDYRVLYDIDDSKQILNLRRIGHRREIYRDL
ncbi:MAG: type II toxin-antitoxin system RelE/ParE family toxin [Pseudanabaena sp. CAN_BIN31]|nr:type II toxin-antitoxin system RelE/ParE family toxin [Pseudanabaena sp. CAN_BIN31]